MTEAEKKYQPPNSFADLKNRITVNEPLEWVRIANFETLEYARDLFIDLCYSEPRLFGAISKKTVSQPKTENQAVEGQQIFQTLSENDPQTSAAREGFQTLAKMQTSGLVTYSDWEIVHPDKTHQQAEAKPVDIIAEAEIAEADIPILANEGRVRKTIANIVEKAICSTMTDQDIQNITSDPKAVKKHIADSEIRIIKRIIHLSTGNPYPEDEALFLANQSRSDKNADLTQAMIASKAAERPLFQTRQVKEMHSQGELIPFKTPEAALDFESFYESYSNREKAKRQISIATHNLYWEALNSPHPSNLARMVQLCLEHKALETLPKPTHQLSLDESAPIGLYRSDLVPYIDLQTQSLTWASVEDDASPGGMGIGQKLCEQEGITGPLDVLANVIKSSDRLRHHFTILRSGSVFDRPEHTLIQHELEQRGVLTSVINIEDLRSAEDIQPGHVLLYSHSGALFPTPQTQLFEQLCDPKLLSEKLELGWTSEQITHYSEQTQKAVEDGLRQYRKYLTGFTQVAIDYITTKIYPPELFGPEGVYKTQLQQLVETEAAKRNNIAASIIARQGQDLSFINQPESFRAIYSKMGDVIPYLPGFKEYLEKEGHGSPEEIQAFYQHSVETVPAIEPNTGIPEFDTWLSQTKADILSHPESWMGKAADDPIGRVNWGARSAFGATHPESQIDWTQKVEHVFQTSDTPFVFQRFLQTHVFSGSRPDSQLSIIPFSDIAIASYWGENLLTTNPAILRVSPYVFGDQVSNGIFTGEKHNDHDKTAHGGSGSFIGGLKIQS